MRPRSFFAGSAAGILFACSGQAAPVANPGDTPEFPTRFANSGKPLQVLLNEGFRIVSSHMGIDTMGFVLEHDGKWMACSLRNTDKAGPDQMLSQCFALN